MIEYTHYFGKSADVSSFTSTNGSYIKRVIDVRDYRSGLSRNKIYRKTNYRDVLLIMARVGSYNKEETISTESATFYIQSNFQQLGVPAGKTVTSIRGSFWCRWTTRWKKSWTNNFKTSRASRQLPGSNRRNLFFANPNELSCGPLELRDNSGTLLHTLTPTAYCGRLENQEPYDYYPRKIKYSAPKLVLSGAQNFIQCIGNTINTSYSSDTIIRLQLSCSYPPTNLMKVAESAIFPFPGNAYSKNVLLKIKTLSLFIEYS